MAIVGQLTFSAEPIGLDWSRTIAREVKHAYARLVCHPGKGSLCGGSHRYRSDGEDVTLTTARMQNP
jgi:hypothetical protein